MTRSVVASAVLILVHLLAGHLRFLDVIPRSQWLSAAGGVSVAYVCLHLLPEVAAGAEGNRPFWYLLAGLVFFFSLQRIVRSRPRSEAGAFWLSMISFALYNALVGYMVAERQDVLWFTVAMALHFVVNDHALRSDHGHSYDRRGRWLLIAALAAGAVLGLSIRLPDEALVILLALLGGGIVLNVFKEELPDERESRPLAFAAAALAFGVLLHYA